MIAKLFFALAPFSLWQGEVIEEPPVTVSMEVRRPDGTLPLPAGSPVFAGEMLQVDIDLAVERSFLRDNLIPTWRLPLDVPMELRTPWLDGAFRSEWREGPAKGMVSIVLDREVNRVQEILGSSEETQHYGLRRWILVPEQDGEFTLSPASVHFTWASEFADDMVRGLVPMDRQQTVLSSEAWTGMVQALPPTPEEFSGVIGNMSWTVQTTEPRDSLWVWQMEVHGSAWPQADMLPEFPATDGLALQGVRREELFDGYRAIMEFQVEESFTAVRDWVWMTYSPEAPAQFQKWGMPEISLGAATYTAAQLPTAATPKLAAWAEAQAKGKNTESGNWIPWASLLVALTVLAMAAWRWRRKANAALAGGTESKFRKPTPKAPMARASMPKPQAPAAADLLDDLAAQLGCHRADLYASDLAARLAEQTWPEELTQELQAAVEAHAAHHFRGQGPGIGQEKEAELRRQLALRRA